MKVRNGGIFKTISSKDFGLYQAMGFKKVVEEPKIKEVEKPSKKVKIEPIEEEVEKEEIVIPKSKKKK